MNGFTSAASLIKNKRHNKPSELKVKNKKPNYSILSYLSMIKKNNTNKEIPKLKLEEINITTKTTKVDVHKINKFLEKLKEPRVSTRKRKYKNTKSRYKRCKCNKCGLKILNYKFKEHSLICKN